MWGAPEVSFGFSCVPSPKNDGIAFQGNNRSLDGRETAVDPKNRCDKQLKKLSPGWNGQQQRGFNVRRYRRDRGPPGQQQASPVSRLSFIHSDLSVKTPSLTNSMQRICTIQADCQLCFSSFNLTWRRCHLYLRDLWNESKVTEGRQAFS